MTRQSEIIAKYRRTIGAGSKQEAKQRYIRKYVDDAVAEAMDLYDPPSGLSLMELAKDKAIIRNSAKEQARLDAESDFEKMWAEQKERRRKERSVDYAKGKWSQFKPIPATWSMIYEECPEYMDRFIVRAKNRYIICCNRNADIHEDKQTKEFYATRRCGRKFYEGNKPFIIYQVVGDPFPEGVDESKPYSLKNRKVQGPFGPKTDFYVNELVTMEDLAISQREAKKAAKNG